MLTPNTEQAEAINIMVDGLTAVSGCLQASVMGVGKTLMAVETVKRLQPAQVLVIAPLPTRTSWEKTFASQETGLPFKWINSTKTGEAVLTDYTWGVTGVYFIGTELFGRKGFTSNPKGKKVSSGLWSATTPDMVIVDEVHRAQNVKSQTHKALMQLEPKWRLAMSGTPGGNQFEGIHGPARWAFPDHVQFNPWVWQEEWCETVYDPFAARNRKVVGERNPGAFVASLPCYVRLESDYGPVDDQTVEVELSRSQRGAYTDLVERMVTWVADNPVVVEFPITLRARLRQASLGMFSTNAEGEVFFDTDCESPKLDALFALADGEMAGQQVVVFTDSAKFAAVATARLKARYGDASTVEWSGNVAQSKRPANKDLFMSGGARFFVATPAAVGTGTDGLQTACHCMVWLSQSDSRIDNEQGVARLVRTGQNEVVVVRRIVAVGTYDSGQLDKQIVDAMKMRRSITMDTKL